MTPSATSQLPQSDTYSDPSGPKTGKFGVRIGTPSTASAKVSQRPSCSTRTIRPGELQTKQLPSRSNASPPEKPPVRACSVTRPSGVTM